MDLITLADLPELAGTDPKPKSTIVIGRLDDNLRDPRYGKFSITQGDVDSWKRNLAGVFGGEVSFDFDHSSDRGNGTKAAAWVSNISQTGTKNGSLITADAQFTRAGAKAVRDGTYKYTSPTFVENYTDEHGQKHGKALIGGALTNRPVLRKGMPTLSLSRDSFDGVATPGSRGLKAAKRERKRARRELAKLMAAGPEPSRDSRAQMTPTLAQLAKLLDLPEDSDHVTILAAAAAVKPGAPAAKGNAGAGAIAAAAAAQKASKKAKKLAKKNGKSKTMALDAEGHVLLTADQVATLMSGANLGEAAARQLADQTFTVAWEKALSEGRAAPAQEDTMKALFAKEPDLAIKTLDTFVKIVPVHPAGSGAGTSVETPAGMDADRFALHTEAKQLAADKVKADPNLDEGEAYALAAVEIEERAWTLANPGI